MPVLPIQFKLIETQGYLTIAVFAHYFSPGSLSIRTDVYFLSSESFENIFGSPEFRAQSTRRWLQPGESPYPGYCRAPASGICLPVLCNCAKLTEIWNKIQDTKVALGNNSLKTKNRHIPNPSLTDVKAV